MEGTVRWFDEAKGYGFIKPDGGGRDIFCHATKIDTKTSSGVRLLRANEQVEFQIAETPKGPAACKVRLLDSSGQMRRRAEEAVTRG